MSLNFGFATGYELCFSAFQTDGTGRGIPFQDMNEIHPTGAYLGEPITELQFGDIALVYEACRITYESMDVYITDYDFIYYEDMQCYFEDMFVFTTNSTSDYPVFITGNPLGEGEMDFDATAWNALVDAVNTLLNWRASTQQNFGNTGLTSGALSAVGAGELLGLPQKIKLYR